MVFARRPGRSWTDYNADTANSEANAASRHSKGAAYQKHSGGCNRYLRHEEHSRFGEGDGPTPASIITEPAGSPSQHPHQRSRIAMIPPGYSSRPRIGLLGALVRLLCSFQALQVAEHEEIACLVVAAFGGTDQSIHDGELAARLSGRLSLDD